MFRTGIERASPRRPQVDPLPAYFVSTLLVGDCNKDKDLSTEKCVPNTNYISPDRTVVRLPDTIANQESHHELE